MNVVAACWANDRQTTAVGSGRPALSDFDLNQSALRAGFL
jgi:hypothetical protein